MAANIYRSTRYDELRVYRERDFKADSERIATPFVPTAEALAEKADEAHPGMAGLSHVKTLGKSDPVILINDR